MTEQIKPVRRIVCIDDNEKSKCISDAPTPDVRLDPARPGYASTRIWVTDRTPARLKNVRESLNAPHTIEPPSGGSVCRVVTFPPDASYKGKIGAKEVQAFFAAMLQRGCLVRPIGKTVYFMPPYCIETGEMRKLCEDTLAVLDDLRQTEGDLSKDSTALP